MNELWTGHSKHRNPDLPPKAVLRQLEAIREWLQATWPEMDEFTDFDSFQDEEETYSIAQLRADTRLDDAREEAWK